MNIDSRYQILEKAGSGGMAAVYRARDTVLNRDVAVKVLHPHLIEKEEVKKRFLREAQAIARLRHKNIIEIYDYKSDSSDCYIISEFIKGKNLGTFLSEYDISSPFIAAMIISVLADAIGHAHKNNVIHRDLKPENILISENYQLKIADFGIAHIADAESLTITGSISGSPAHMSPEQIDGKDVDLRTDIFSLGTILYLISCGELPFKGNSPASIFKSILMGEYKEPKELNPLIDSRFSAIIQKCLKKNLAERYSSTEELKAELNDYLKGYGITNTEQNLQKFFQEPIEYLDELNKKIAGHLKEYLYKNIHNTESRIQIQDYLNILLYLAPDDDDAKAIFERFSSLEDSERRSKRIKSVLLASAIFLLMAFIVFNAVSYYKRIPDSNTKPAENTVAVTPDDKYPDVHTTPSEEDKIISTGNESERTEEKSEEEMVLKKPKRKIARPQSAREKSQSSDEKEESTIPRFGELNLFVKPYGDIYINNQLAGREKATLNIKLKSGKHFIRVKNPFFFDIEKEISIEPDSKTDLRLVFDNIKPAKLFINTSPECDIYIDGNLLGRSDMYTKSGITIPINTKDGRREILLKASKAGYKDYIRKIELTAGEARTLKINLTKEK